MKKRKFSLTQRFKSFTHAINGFRLMWFEEHNFRIHLIAALFACFLGFFVSLKPIEWALILFAIAMVLAAELMNTAIENVCDFISPELDPRIKKIKDISAACVLLTAIFAILIAAFVFLPKLLSIYFV
jgi:undecaprenol kinase/diacylglycerol kinase (ATP)